MTLSSSQQKIKKTDPLEKAFSDLKNAFHPTRNAVKILKDDGNFSPIGEPTAGFDKTVTQRYQHDKQAIFVVAKFRDNGKDSTEKTPLYIDILNEENDWGIEFKNFSKLDEKVEPYEPSTTLNVAAWKQTYGFNR